MLADNLQKPDADAAPLMLGERLLAAGKLSQRDLERALLAQGEMGGLLGEVLVRLGLVSETDLLTELSAQLDLEIAAKDAYPDTPLRLESVPEHFLLSNRVVPLTETDQEITFSAVKPQDPFLRKALKLSTGKHISLRLGLVADIDAALDRYLEREDEAQESGFNLFDGGDDEFVEHLKDLASEAPVIQRVNQIIQSARWILRRPMCTWSTLMTACACATALMACLQDPASSDY